MTSSTEPHQQAQGRLAHFPIMFFATVMGMLGLALALHAGEHSFATGTQYARIALYASAAMFLTIAFFYTAKTLIYPGMTADEWHHPVRLSFFPTVSISLLLMSVATLAEYPAIAEPLWMVGTALQGVLSLMVIADWIGHRSFKHGHLNAAWFIPPVGNLIVPIAGAQLGHADISWLFFSWGMIFWLVLLTLVMNRLTFHDPLPGRLQPTLVILIAPPAVGFIAWIKLSGALDVLGLFLLNSAYVFALIVATQLPRILRLPFALSFWALSFPLAALTIATFLYATETESTFHRYLGAGLLAVLLAIILILVGRTTLAITRNEICQPE
ncbi:tellurite resistance protein [Rhodovulum imhoffii]|uniref:Tellurite resistance protein n=1 Tax=Rhodovulum imhoffii TaxID=365340 RepID=A0A2T5BVZ7_9RHOB|nr:SLAC1 anion channel family protein [Rhodovulum imhoffii]MBK5933556.1 C4-dicarboxylate ABC transporter [Rhodovulum imhoffii]PTN03812.1 tellurite resistance protein [Rhodovulum imhoffii]